MKEIIFTAFPTVPLTVVLSIVYASFFEWTLHRFVMHKPLPGIMRYPFEAHAVTHHRLFRADHSYHLQKDEDKWTIPMAWWNGPVLVLLSSSPAAVLSWYFGQWPLWLTAALTIAAYYCTYEYIHWCMHLPLPRRRLVEKFWLFKRLNGHHILHHRYMGKNFNVVLPLADLVLGTLLRRSKISFTQPAVSDVVPDLQPR